MIENNQQQQQPVEDINKAKIKVLKKKKKGKANLYSPISSYVQSYSMVKDIKHPQAWITFGQLIEIAPKSRGVKVPLIIDSGAAGISDAKQVEEIEEEGSEKEEEKEIENEDEDEEYKEVKLKDRLFYTALFDPSSILTNEDTIENIVNESNRQLCYYCQKKSYQEYEELTQEIEYNHADIEDLSKITLIELSIGKLSDNQSISLMESYCSDKMTLLGNLLN
ncbi:unnamed protein product [Rhizophagus irregularis]|nr:unnamed protein product [Rhizophagus irregularis]